MQLFAYSNQGKIVSAQGASKEEGYTCLGCDQIVRLRSGAIRAPHFYHLSKKHCSLSGKSAAHLQIQYRLARMIPSCTLEESFPSVGRIADVYWPEEKLVFEVQCSPITSKEVNARNQDYESLGLTVIWIFHAKRFRRRTPPCRLFYFTNIDRLGRGSIYDREGPLSFPIDLKRARPRLKRRSLYKIFFHLLIEFFC